ncbi:sulfurtransferase TusA family protein [Testudinibacter sp. P80/BLE/0925]|uniref:sulfurtransferase TusA family protein n=1 Tax=Testudinibacter sp. TW-1 TaxID=3417757 RepID=UPI003D3698E6
MQYQLDTTEYRCPLPLLMVKKALSDLQTGDELRILLNTESTIEDFKLLCETVSCILVSTENSSAQFSLIVRKIG